MSFYPLHTPAEFLPKHASCTTSALGGRSRDFSYSLSLGRQECLVGARCFVAHSHKVLTMFLTAFYRRRWS